MVAWPQARRTAPPRACSGCRRHDPADPEHQLPRPRPGHRVHLGRGQRRGRHPGRTGGWLIPTCPAGRSSSTSAGHHRLGTLKYQGVKGRAGGLRPPASCSFGLGAFIFGLIEGNTYGWWAPKHPFEVAGFASPLDSISIVPYAIIGGVLALGLFAWVERRRQRQGKFVLFDFALDVPMFRYGNLAGTIVSLGEFGLLFVLPLFLQAVLGLSAFDTGLIFLSLAIGAFFAAPLAATLAKRYGPRRTVSLGMALKPWASSHHAAARGRRDGTGIAAVHLWHRVGLRPRS
jgi:hypothetical protein